MPRKSGLDQIKVCPDVADKYVRNGAPVTVFLALYDLHFFAENQAGHVLFCLGAEVLMRLRSVDSRQPDPNRGAAVENSDRIPVGDTDALAGEFLGQSDNAQQEQKYNDDVPHDDFS
jgi:hypothetical protein